MAQVQRLGNRGQLMHDDVRPCPGHRLCDLLGIERVRDHGHGPQRESIACLDSLRVIP